MKKQINKKTLRLRTFLVFTLILLAALGCMHLLHSYQEKEEKLKASYTAEFTIRRIESQFKPLSCRIRSDETAARIRL